MSRLLKKLERINLRRMYKKAQSAGSIPYKSNRDVLEIFDIDRDEKKGKRKAIRLIREIDGWIDSLEKLKNAAEVIEKDTEMANFS